MAMAISAMRARAQGRHQTEVAGPVQEKRMSSRDNSRSIRQLQIKSAPKERGVRMASHRGRHKDALDLLDQQPPDVIEATWRAPKRPSGRANCQNTELPCEILKYMEDYALTEARAKTAFFDGITGLEEPDHA
jgi:hypothetical protein